MPKFKLSDVTTKEISLVERGANNKKFFLLKSAEGDQVIPEQEFLAAMMTVDTEKFDELSKEWTPEYKTAMQAAYKLVKVLRENMPDESMSKIIQQMLGEKGETPMSKEATSTTPDNKDNVSKADLTALSKEHRELIEKTQKENEELKKSHAELEKKFTDAQEVQLTKEFVSKASEFKHLGINAAEFGPALKAISKASAEAYEKTIAVLKAADKAVEEAELLKQIGVDAGPNAGATDAWGKIEKMAEGLVSKSSDGKMTLTKAIDIVLKSPEGKRLYQADLDQRGAA